MSETTGPPAGDTAPEVEAVARALHDGAGGAYICGNCIRTAEKAIAALDRVRADSARGEDHRVTPEMVYEVAYAWCRKLSLPLMSPPRAPEAIDQLGHEIERLRLRAEKAERERDACREALQMIADYGHIGDWSAFAREGLNAERPPRT